MSTSERLPRRSLWLIRWFLWYARRYVRRHFHAVRLTPPVAVALPADGPLIVVMNHPSWWDPLIAGLVLQHTFPRRALYAPMDAASLEQYRLFGRMGLFGVELDALSGARTFLDTGRAILATPGTLLAITAEGRFTDVRVRPTRLRPGIGHLAARLDRGMILPLALEYPFWAERLPEALAAFGSPLAITPGTAPRDWTERAAAALEAAQDRLADLALRRDPAAFSTLLAGRAGVGGVYDAWRRARASFTGRPFRPEHGTES